MDTTIWQDFDLGGQFRHWWQELDGRRLSAMTTAIIVLLLVAGIVALSILRPGIPSFLSTPTDRDRERQLAELRALSGYRTDPRLP
jgi:hypothetical protein